MTHATLPITVTVDPPNPVAGASVKASISIPADACSHLVFDSPEVFRDGNQVFMRFVTDGECRVRPGPTVVDRLLPVSTAGAYELVVQDCPFVPPDQELPVEPCTTFATQAFAVLVEQPVPTPVPATGELSLVALAAALVGAALRARATRFAR